MDKYLCEGITEKRFEIKGKPIKEAFQLVYDSLPYQDLMKKLVFGISQERKREYQDYLDGFRSRNVKDSYTSAELFWRGHPVKQLIESDDYIYLIIYEHNLTPH